MIHENSMKVLITGANGQLGMDISDLCRRNGHDVTAYGSKELDITRYDLVTKTIQTLQPDIIINCAAYNAVDLAESEWEKAFFLHEPIHPFRGPRQHQPHATGLIPGPARQSGGRHQSG